MSTRRLLASLAATVLVLTGCSSDGDGQAVRTVDETTTSTSTGPELTPAELVRAAAQAPAHHEAVEMEMVIAADGELVMRTAGTASVDNLDGDMSVEMEGLEFRMLLVGGDYYYQYSAMPPGYDWVSLSGAAVTELSGVDPTAAAGNPTDTLAALAEVADDVESLGSDELSGVSVQGYRAKLSRDTMTNANLAAGIFDEDFASYATDVLPETYEMDVWIDGDGLPRRQTWSMDIVTGSGGALTRFDYRVDYLEWGAPLEVSAPNPAVTMTMQQFLATRTGG